MSKIEHEGQAELVEDFKRRQRNTLLGDSMRNGNNFRMDTFYGRVLKILYSFREWPPGYLGVSF